MAPSGVRVVLSGFSMPGPEAWAGLSATRITSTSFLFPEREGHLPLGDREKEDKEQSLTIINVHRKTF